MQTLKAGRVLPTLRDTILKNYTVQELENLLANNQQFRVIFGGEFGYTEVWREKCFLEFSIPPAFFDLAQGRLSPLQRYLEIATYHVLSPDSLRICDKVYLYMEARRRADKRAEKYFASLLTPEEKRYAKEESYVPLLLQEGGDYEDEGYREDRTEQGDEYAFQQMLNNNDDLLLHSAVSSGRIDFVNRALLLRLPDLSRNFNLADYVNSAGDWLPREHIYLKRLPHLLREVLLANQEINQDYDDLLEAAVSSFNLTILDFFLSLYIDHPSVDYELTNFVERYRVTRDVLTAYSILQRIKHRISGDGLVTLSETGNTDLYLLVAQRRKYDDAVHVLSVQGQAGNYLFVQAVQGLIQG